MSQDRPRNILDRIQDQLEELGVRLDLNKELELPNNVKFFGVGLGLKDSVKEMNESPRDQVVMVRVDGDTARTLDDWVESGALKSRSEAAALFIREGLKIHADELNELRSALDDLETARERVRRKAKEVFGDTNVGQGNDEPPTPGE
jgi:Arc/MetJ-type ribon-helix-helix transcriptional regulator